MFSTIKLVSARYGGQSENPFKTEDWNPPYTFSNYEEFLSFLETEFMKITNVTSVSLDIVFYYKDRLKKYLPHDFNTPETRAKTIDILTHCSNISCKYLDGGITVGFIDQKSDWCYLDLSFE